MFVYLGILALLAAAGISLNDRQARQFLPFVLLFLLWFMGGRYFVGCDFTGYLNRFANAAPISDLWAVFSKPEPGFQILIGSVKDAGLDYMWLNVFASAIFLACVYGFCRAFRSPLMILALLFPIMIIQLGMSGLRQALAAGFIMVAAVRYVNGRRVLTGAMILIAGLFHTSAFVFFPIAFLAGQKITSYKLVAAVMLLTPVSAFLFASRLDVYVDRYVDQIYGEMSSGGALIRYFMIAVPVVLFLRFRDRFKAYCPEVYDIFVLFSIIIIAMLPVALISTVALHRLNYYVMPVSILMFVYAAFVMSPKRRFAIPRAMPVVLYGGYCTMWLLTSKHASLCYIPYKNFSFI